MYIPTSCVDVIPTLLSETHQSIPEWCEGNILPGFDGAKDVSERDIYCVDAKSNPKRAALNNATVSLIKGDYKLISYLGYEEEMKSSELYDLSRDPEERQDISGSHTSILSDLREIMGSQLKSINAMYKDA